MAPVGPEPTERTAITNPKLGGAGRRLPVLTVLAGPDAGVVLPLEPGRVAFIGRREDADLPLRDDGVSRRHASVLVHGEVAVLTDLGSANGTFVDGARVREARLEDGARVSLGASTVLKFAWADDLEVRWQLRLAQGAQQDPLTGLYNRRYLDERLAAEVSAALRHGRPLALVLADIDHFKAVNDVHGHLAGDEALRTCARVLRDAVRREDVLARFGGEEFVVLARETAAAGVRTLAERMRSAVERTPCTLPRATIQLTVSIGAATVAVLGADTADPRPELALLAAADRALYQAKATGRNRVVILDEEPGNTGP